MLKHIHGSENRETKKEPHNTIPANHRTARRGVGGIVVSIVDLAIGVYEFGGGVSE